MENPTWAHPGDGRIVLQPPCPVFSFGGIPSKGRILTGWGSLDGDWLNLPLQGLPVPWGTILWLVMAILFAFIGFGLGRELLRLLNRWLEESTETDGAGAEKVLSQTHYPDP